jgi:hypothetical protein
MKASGFLFNKERALKEVSSGLGPGTYERNDSLTRNRSTSAVVSRTERNSLNRSGSALIGPGSYNI